MIHAATLLLYIAAMVLWLGALARGARGRGSQAAGWVAATGVAVHFLSLSSFQQTYGELPLVGLAPSLSTLAFLIGLGLVVTLALGEAGRVGILLVPLMVVLEGVAVGLGVEPAPHGAMDFQGAWFALHVTLALAAIGAVAVAAAAGALYLVQLKQLKSRRLGNVFRFVPPLTTLDRMGRAGMVTGLITLTLSLVLGWAWTWRFRSSLEFTDPKTIWAMLIWAAIVGGLAARRGRESERGGAWGAVVTFGVIVVSYLLVRSVAGGGLFL